MPFPFGVPAAAAAAKAAETRGPSGLPSVGKCPLLKLPERRRASKALLPRFMAGDAQADASRDNDSRPSTAERSASSSLVWAPPPWLLGLWRLDAATPQPPFPPDRPLPIASPPPPPLPLAEPVPLLAAVLAVEVAYFPLGVVRPGVVMFPAVPLPRALAPPDLLPAGDPGSGTGKITESVAPPSVISGKNEVGGRQLRGELSNAMRNLVSVAMSDEDLLGEGAAFTGVRVREAGSAPGPAGGAPELTGFAPLPPPLNPPLLRETKSSSLTKLSLPGACLGFPPLWTMLMLPTLGLGGARLIKSSEAGLRVVAAGDAMTVAVE